MFYIQKHKKKKPNKMVEGHPGDIIKCHVPQIKQNLQPGEQLYHRSSPAGDKVLSSASGCPAWGSGLRRKRLQGFGFVVGLGVRCSMGLGKQTLLKGACKFPSPPGPKEKAVTMGAQARHCQLV